MTTGRRVVYQELVCQKAWKRAIFVGVKMSFDLPADLVQRLTIKAVERGVELDTLVTEACVMLLDKPVKPKKARRRKSPLPIFKGGHPAKPGEEVTPEKIAEILWGSGE